MRIEPRKVETEPDDEETWKVGNATVHIRQDQDPLNPRTDYENPWSWYSNHRRYNFDKVDGKWLVVNTIMPEEQDEIDKGYSIPGLILLHHPEILDVAPVYMLDHSGLRVSLSSFNDKWDSGIGAYAVITRKNAEEYWPKLKGDDKALKERAREALESEVETLDKYLRGEVYGYVVEGPDGLDGDACWGFYDVKDCLEEAVGSVSVKDATAVTLGSLELANELDAKAGMAVSQVIWIDGIRDGEMTYCAGVILIDRGVAKPCGQGRWSDKTGYSAEELARLLGYEKGEFEGHSVRVWNESVDNGSANG